MSVLLPFFTQQVCAHVSLVSETVISHSTCIHVILKTIKKNDCCNCALLVGVQITLITGPVG